MPAAPEGVELFAERQWLPSWVVALLLGSELFPVALLLYAPPSQRGSLLAVVGLTLGLTWLPVLLLFAVLDTRVTSAGLEARFGLAGWIRYRFAREEIAWAARRAYRPLVEFGGWGIRGWGRRRALNIRGAEGVELGLRRSGRESTMMIGSQRAAELEAALRELGLPGRD